MEPKRIQRKRTKGWRMPSNTVYVGRPTKWGNPNRVVDGNVKLAVALYEMQFVVFQDNPGVRAIVKRNIEEAKTELRGKNLACWCPLNQPCHADVLLKIANEHSPKT